MKSAFPILDFSARMLSLVFVLSVTGCISMAPNYERPDSPVTEEFRGTPAGIADSDDIGGNILAAELDWKQVFVDERLQEVINAALKNNRDLRVALLNIEKARAQYRIQRAGLFPHIDASASHNASRTSASSSASGQSQIKRTANIDVGLSSWELDLFGRVRSLKDEALENFYASEQTQRSTRMSLVAEVAQAWLNVWANHEKMTLAQKTMESQLKTLVIVQQKHDIGIVSGVDVSQIQTSVEQARADIANYKTALAQSRNALELLVGEAVDERLLPSNNNDNNIDHNKDKDMITLTLLLPSNLSSDILLQRPDVLYAEHILKASNANIGAARAAFFPKISLTTSAGRSSDELSNLFDAGTRTWSFIPQISVPIFNAGSLRASLDQANIQKDIAIAEYEKTIQSAFKEVSDALAVRTNLQEWLDAQSSLVMYTEKTFSFTSSRYQYGMQSYLEVLDAQRSLYAAQQDLIDLQLNEKINRVTLYKVFGGGADSSAYE